MLSMKSIDYMKRGSLMYMLDKLIGKYLYIPDYR